jgi:hypothetical protein
MIFSLRLRHILISFLLRNSSTSFKYTRDSLCLVKWLSKEDFLWVCIKYVRKIQVLLIVALVDLILEFFWQNDEICKISVIVFWLFECNMWFNALL